MLVTTGSVQTSLDRIAARVVLIAGLWFLAVYVTAVGQGFLSDDFRWIAQSILETPSDLPRLFSDNLGFYRPVVAVSFGLDYALFGLRPLPFGVTNVLLLVLTAGAIVRLALSLRMRASAAAIAAALWTLNPHGINMALLWISGRTSILLTLFAVLAATAFVRRKLWACGVWALLAMLSKEEAVLLPLVFLGWGLVERRVDAAAGRSWLRSASRSAPAFLALFVYLPLRFHSGAITPASAPPYYQFLTDVRLIGRNALEYLDRTTTFPLALAVIASAITRRLPAFDADQRRIALFGAIWLIGGCAITVLIPSRSSLYAVLPSVGPALVGASWLTGLARPGDRDRTRAVTIALVVLAAVCVPVYRARNHRWLEPARTSSIVLSELRRVGQVLPEGATLRITDRSGRRAVEGACGSLLVEALRLTSGRRDLHVWLEPPLNGWELAGWRRPAGEANVVDYEFDGTRLTVRRPR
ncbi:MAG: hypothetical protein ACM3NQ_03400 [Bacteroidales bacterium]